MENRKEKSIDLRGRVTSLSNMLIEANKTGALNLQQSAMQNILEVLANKPGAVDTLNALQGRRERIFLTQRAKKLIGKAVMLGIDPDDLRTEISKNMEIAQLKGSQRITRGDLGDLASEVNIRLKGRASVLVL